MNETFKQQVFEIIKMIPKGRVTTYGAIAKAVGFPNHSRHVGNALRNYDEDFPAHRVCSACGIISAESCILKFTFLFCFEDFITLKTIDARFARAKNQENF